MIVKVLPKSKGLAKGWKLFAKKQRFNQGVEQFCQEV
jgi:hypothetical protein